jgi:hypothetical protein
MSSNTMIVESILKNFENEKDHRYCIFVVYGVYLQKTEAKEEEKTNNSIYVQMPITAIDAMPPIIINNIFILLIISLSTSVL